MRGVLFLGLFGVALAAAVSSTASAETASPATALPVAAPAVGPSTPSPEIGEETTLWALAHPDNFAWPARFTCRAEPGGPEALVLLGKSLEELNGELAARNVFLEDCRGGFSLESLTPQDGKLDRIVGEALNDDT